MRLLQGAEFDGILFPVNFATWHKGNFGPQVLELAKQKGVGIAGIKPMAKRPLPKGADRSQFPGCWYEPLSEPDEALTGLRFTLSHPVTTAFPPADVGLLKLGWKLGAKFKPLAAAEVESIKKKGLAEDPLFRYPREAR